MGGAAVWYFYSLERYKTYLRPEKKLYTFQKIFLQPQVLLWCL